MINRNRETLFRFILPDHIVVQEALDLRRSRQRRPLGRGLLLLIVVDDLVADVDAFIADVNTRARD